MKIEDNSGCPWREMLQPFAEAVITFQRGCEVLLVDELGASRDDADRLYYVGKVRLDRHLARLDDMELTPDHPCGFNELVVDLFAVAVKLKIAADILSRALARVKMGELEQGSGELKQKRREYKLADVHASELLGKVGDALRLLVTMEAMRRHSDIIGQVMAVVGPLQSFTDFLNIKPSGEDK